ncbi:MAG: chemotaxis protein CheW [Planctomycetaceae bacterium]|nr:chemotaxis protein CheW [Planctomycetaceae bacterium]
MDTQSSFCTFRVGSLKLGVEVHRVQEVIRQQRMTRVPGSPQTVSGLMNLRGQIVTALDLRRCLSLPVDKNDEPNMNVVIRTADDSVSLLVNEIGDVLVVDNAQFEPPPETLRGAARKLIRGVYKLDSGLLMALDTDAVLTSAA